MLQIGSFNEEIEIAAGEDIDLGLRLREVGPLSYAPSAQVIHVFEGGLPTFVKRFVRYGRGNKQLQQYYQYADLAPRRFSANVPSFPNRMLATLQYASLWWGYHVHLGPRSIVYAPQHPTSQGCVALFIDGDNVSPQVVKPLLAEITRRGWTLSIRQVYRKSRLVGAKTKDAWMQIVQQYGMELFDIELQKPNAVWI